MARTRVEPPRELNAPWARPATPRRLDLPRLLARLTPRWLRREIVIRYWHDYLDP